MQIWAKMWKKDHMIKDLVIENNDSGMTRTKKVFAALESVCREFDIAVPVWLESNIKAFKKYSKTEFTEDNFIETIDFDRLEFQVIKEDG